MYDIGHPTSISRLINFFRQGPKVIAVTISYKYMVRRSSPIQTTRR